MKKLEEAAAAYKEGLKVDPSNAALASDLASVEEEIKGGFYSFSLFCVLPVFLYISFQQSSRQALL